MILFELKCTADHRFEAWFRDGAAYEAQIGAQAVSCPLCGDTGVSKAPMAPSIARPRAAAEAAERQRLAEAMKQLAEVRRAVEENCDYVGERFAEEARRIHYGETDPRGIYGETTAAEAEALQEEGVTFARIPWLQRGDS